MEFWTGQDSEAMSLDLWEWLSSLPGTVKVGGSGPRPGRLHVAHALSGGHSGRKQTFVVGLDDSRFPGAGLNDPLLLDEERGKLSPKLPKASAESGPEVGALCGVTSAAARWCHVGFPVSQPSGRPGDVRQPGGLVRVTASCPTTGKATREI